MQNLQTFWEVKDDNDIKKLLTNSGDYDRISELFAIEKVAKTKIKKFLTIRNDCDKLIKMS